jgi:hypothetical protein
MGTEIIAITGILASSALLVLVWRQPWRAPGARLMVLWLFRGYPARHTGDTRSLTQLWTDGPGGLSAEVSLTFCPDCSGMRLGAHGVGHTFSPPPIGSMSAARAGGSPVIAR